MYRRFIKRFLDVLFSVIALPVLIILIIGISPLVFLTDGLPIFYVSDRRGKEGEIYKMYKFRTMKVNSQDIRNADGSTYNSEKDSRVFSLGYILRKTSIDEIPQIINVLKGNMSFVGPRPNLPSKGYDKLSDIEKYRLCVRPGITGYSQAYYRNSISQQEKLKNDVYYIQHISVVLDMKIILKTITSVLGRKNINAN